MKNATRSLEASPLGMTINLLTPGPTPVPTRIIEAMTKCNLHHRSEEFEVVLKDVWDGLKYVFETKNTVYLFAASGTGGMEAAVCNAFNPGEKVIVIDGGKFGERWAGISKAFGLNVVNIKVEWGKALDVGVLKKTLSEHNDVTGVLFQACETSTGVNHPVKEIAEVTQANTDALVICDGITGTGVFSIPADEWGIDMVVSGSQKAFMLPPGLAFLSVSPRAWSKVENCKSPRYYLDLKREKKAFDQGTTAYTPAISLILGLQESLKIFREDGLAARFERTANLANTTREAFKEMGLEIYASSAPSPSLTAVVSPAGVDSGKLVKEVRKKFNVWIAGGQDQLKGKIFRVSHMGAVTPEQLSNGIEQIGIVLSELGAPVQTKTDFQQQFARL